MPADKSRTANVPSAKLSSIEMSAAEPRPDHGAAATKSRTAAERAATEMRRASAETGSAATEACAATSEMGTAAKGAAATAAEMSAASAEVRAAAASTAAPSGRRISDGD